MNGASVELERALRERGVFRLLAAEERAWASAMFSGARHRLRLAMATEVAERFLDGIEDAEFDLGAHLLADITGARAGTDGAEVIVEIEALTIEDGDFVILDMVKCPPHRTVKAHRTTMADLEAEWEMLAA